MTSERIERLREAIADYQASGKGTLFDHEAEEARAAVRSRALGLLDQRGRSRHELRERLIAAEFAPEVIDAVLDDFERTGLINDEVFAREWVRQRHQRRKKSARVLDLELQDKGVGAAERASALAQIDEDDEEATAIELARKKARSVKNVPGDHAEYQKVLRRIVGVLARRGFNEAMSLRIARAELERRREELAEG